MLRRYRPCCTIPDVHLRCLISTQDTHSPGLNLVPDSTRTTAYVLCMRLCSKKLLSDIARARTLFVPLPRSSPVFLPPSYYTNRASSLLLFKELYQSHFAPGLCFSSRWQLLATLRANSKRYRLPLFLSLSSALSCPDLPPSFYSLDIPSRKEKNEVEMPHVDRPSNLTIAFLFFD